MRASAALRLSNLEGLVAEAERRGASPYSDRLVPAAETVARMKPFMREFGVTRLARVTGLDSVGIPVWSAIRPNSKTLAQSQGKGIDDPSAQASALMEAIEVATAERSDFDAVRASPWQLSQSGVAFDRLDCLLRRGGAPIGEHEPVDWLEGFDIAQDRPTLVPFEAATLWDAEVRPRYWQSTDGLASGNTLWEAAFHGLCERVERDAMALWLLRSDEDIVARCVDPASFADPALDGLCRAIAKAGLQMRLFDASCDSETPVFAAFLSPPADGFEDHWKHFDLSMGSGCHPTPLRAALRAVTEAAQTRVTTISAARDDFDPAQYNERLDPSLLIYPRAQPRLRRELADDEPVGREAYLSAMIGRLGRVGAASVIVVPFEPGDRGFAVARVFVPDLENPSGDRRERFGRRAMRFVESRA